VRSVEEALGFIAGIQGFNMTPQFEEDFRQYVEGPMPYPKRYKVRARIYFIVIKTMAESLEEFKANGKNMQEAKAGEELEGMELQGGEVIEKPRFLRPKEQALLRLNDELPGWYEATVNFKRVVRNLDTGKFDYVDTTFVARVKAFSGMDCYNRVIDHLRTRSDIDPRSQFPSAKGKNYQFTYLGFKPYAEVAV
jgi:alkanesulfonate monooxygenase SsuD/methylene tetrahydromethanopterin reductase-like flavin-dependent oxidoreductase (luciferase family)